MNFIRLVLANVRAQYKNYFFSKRIYLSLFIWPVIEFINIYYTYKPFNNDILLNKIGLKHDEEIYLYLLIGFVAMRFFYTLIQSAWQSSYLLRYSGALELIYMSPSSRMAMLIGNSIASLFGSVWMFIIFASGMIVIFKDFLQINILSALVSILLLCVLAVIWGVFLNSLFLLSRDSGFLYTIFQGPIDMFTGAKMPFSYMPLWAKIIGYIFPLTYIIIVLRKALMYDAGFVELLPDFIICSLIGTFLLIISHLMMKIGERNAMENGTATLF
ncbi:multidrug ABC transporter permease [Vallitalea longa]|uniref:Multidrug ABC transporter permease n=1 Tax=Vallitalea longa TaxID=2936439 RepID=A0A9W5YD50_9FIRM|nr:ABC transporter permease [Vallitalea longa]GKX31777.1 multidrug ABC transporter permease [Vallitalea longa]